MTIAGPPSQKFVSATNNHGNLGHHLALGTHSALSSTRRSGVTPIDLFISRKGGILADDSPDEMIR